MTETKTEWYIIVNPHAGSGKTIDEWTKAEKRLCELGVAYTTAYTGYKSHAKELAFDAAAQGYRKIAAVGGDGSVHEIFYGILSFCDKNDVPSESFYVGVIPIGSGNDWIKSLHVPHDIIKVVDLMARESFSTQDVVVSKSAGNRVGYMANVGGTGFDARVCVSVNAKKARGHRSKTIYASALFWTILGMRRINVSIFADDECIFNGPCFSVAIGNGPFSGGGMRQTGLADINDGFIDVMVVPVISVATIIKNVHRIFEGTTNQSDVFVYRKCRCLRIVPLNSRSAEYIEIDGEVEGNLPLEVTATGRKINVLSDLF